MPHTHPNILILSLFLAGGLALFLFGMQLMSESLRLAAGAGLQRLLAKTVHRRSSGFLLGTALGATIHSSAATVMLIGFVNAGLMTLGQSIAPVLGANVGTTLSMQAIAFRISDWLFVPLVCGVALAIAAPPGKGRQLGRVLIGFALLFLGMETMSGAIRPHRDMLALYFQRIDGTTLPGLLAGIAIATAVTAVWQSSGATIAIAFALIQAGVFTSLQQVYPLVLGAHLGTCATALLGSLGTHADARRCAAAHLAFNVLNVLLAIVLQPLFVRLVALSATDLVRQTANLHSLVMLVAAVLALPFTARLATLLQRTVYAGQPVPGASHLDFRLTHYPERAIVALLSESRRAAAICLESLALTARIVMRGRDRTALARIQANEASLNAIKLAVQAFTALQTRVYLSRRQIVMLHHLSHCMADIERIGDHIERLCRSALGHPATALDPDARRALLMLYARTRRLLSLVIDSLNPSHDRYAEYAARIMNSHAAYAKASASANELFMRTVQAHTLNPKPAMDFKDYIVGMDRMVRHIKSIALAQHHADFRIKRSKLDRDSS